MDIYKRLKHLIPQYCGIGKRSDRFVSFLKGRGASERLVRMFDYFSFSGQIELDNGIIFSENEIIVRNEFHEGKYFIFGSDDKYSPFVINLETCDVGIVRNYVYINEIDVKSVTSLHISLPEFLAIHLICTQDVIPPYCTDKHFNVDAISIMRSYSGHSGIVVSRTTSKFRQWLESVGINKTFPLYEVTPKTCFFAGECTIGSELEIMEANFKERRDANPMFVCIGTCPDGCLVVLDLSTPEPSVGYVAIMEIGDNPSWENYYVCVSKSFADFIHDSNFLSILPCDYYQALELGYRPKSSKGHHCEVAKKSCFLDEIKEMQEPTNELQDISYSSIEHCIPPGVCYRIFSSVKSLSAENVTIAKMIPSTSEDIWLASSSGFGMICYQISCLIDKLDFDAFIKSNYNVDLIPSIDFSMRYHTESICWLFQKERENIINANQLQDDYSNARYLSCSILLGKYSHYVQYCYDTSIRVLSCYIHFGR